MSITRTATLAILGSALTATALVGPAGSAAAKPIRCEPAAPFGCSSFDQVRQANATTVPSYCRAPHARDNVAGVPAGMTVGQYINRLDFACR